MPDPRIVFAFRLTLAIVLVVCAPAAILGQTQPPIRSKVVLVPLDVRVSDRNGDPVRDLTAADFTVYEDGIRQEIAHFMPMTLAGSREGSPLADDHPLASASSAHRTFILVLGTGDINAPGKGLDGLIDFVKHRLAATDRVGVTAYLRTSEPTTDHAAVLRFLERYREDCKRVYDRIAWDRRPRDGVLGDLSSETLARIDAVFSTPGIPAFKELPGVPGKAAARYATHNYIRWTIQHVGRIPGEKHVLVLAADRLPGVGGRVFKENPNAHVYVKLANEARVALSYINTGGVSISTAGDQSVRFGPTGRLPRIDHGDFFAPTDHRAVAERTGGIASFYRYASAPLDRLERASRFQYLIGYYPTTTHAPDVHRTVRVEVNRRGVTAQYRHGYRLAPSINDEQEFRAAAAEFRLTTELARLSDTAGQTKLLQQGFRFAPSLRITPQGIMEKDGGGELTVALAFNAARVYFTRDENSSGAVLHVYVVADDAKGVTVGELNRTVELSLSAKDIAQSKTQWIEFDVTVPLIGNPARVRAAVYDYDRDTVRGGSAAVPPRRR
jgi:VWFA-related protein